MAVVVQPLTVQQIARKLRVPLKCCSEVTASLRNRGHLACLNPDALCSRVYWLTPLGVEVQAFFFRARCVSTPQHFVPDADWKLYGRVCFSHRTTVVRTLRRPMRPARIKREARSRDPGLRMSANNVRDVIGFLKTHGVVEPVHRSRQTHPEYQLTAQGRVFQDLLERARQGVLWP